MPFDYHIFQQSRPRWFSANIVYRFRTTFELGRGAYNCSGDPVASEAMDFPFGPKEKGGVIVFPAALTQSAEFSGQLKDRIADFLQTHIKRWEALGRLRRTVNRPPNKNLTFSIGPYYQGWYRTGQHIYDSTCLAVNLVGITIRVVLELAAEIAREFDQPEVLVFDVWRGSIFTVNYAARPIVPHCPSHQPQGESS